jgi:exosortase/archaeosortase family protein
MDGNTLRLSNKEFFVDEACSGIVSVMSVIACAVIYGIWRNRPPLHVILLAIAGVAWATFMNVARITIIAVAYTWWGLDWSSGNPHEILGLIVFTITFLALVSTDYLLVALLAPIAKGGEEPSGPISYGAQVVKWFDRLQSWGAPRSEKVVTAAAARSRGRNELWSRFALGVIPLLAFGTLAAAQFTVPTMIGLASKPLPPHRFEQAMALDEPAMPANIGPLQRVGFEAQKRDRDDILGEYSRMYRYQDADGAQYVISCDFPFGPEWHDLRICYDGAGWKIGRTMLAWAPGVAGYDKWGYVQVQMDKPDGVAGLLTYSVFDERGSCLEPPHGSLVGDIWRSVQKQYNEKQPARFFQIQVFTTAPRAVGEKQAAKALDLLLAARAELYQFITQSGATAERIGK